MDKTNKKELQLLLRWLKEQKIYGKFINNVIKYSHYMIRGRQIPLNLTSAFPWDKTNEGSEFWVEYSIAYEVFLKNIP